MIWTGKALVRDVKQVTVNKDGKPLGDRAFEVVSMVDTQTGGDVSLNFPLGGCPWKVGDTPNFDLEIKGGLRGFNVSYWVVNQHVQTVPAKKA